MGTYKKVRSDGSTVWYYDFVHRKIRYNGLGGTTKSQAIRTQVKILESILNETYDHTQNRSNPKFKDCALEYLEEYSKIHKRSWDRDRQMIDHLTQFFKAKHLSQIDSAGISRYKLFRQKEGVAPATINRELSTLRQIYNWAIERRYVTQNPVHQKMFLQEPSGRTRFLSHDEIKILLEQCPDHIRSVVWTAINTGLRLGEILNLTWNCVFIEKTISDPFIEVRISKSGKKRFIPLNQMMIDLFTRLKSESNGLEFVFLNKWGKRLKSIDSQFRKTVNNTNISDLRFHDLRHTFASHFLMSGGDLYTLKELLGHSNMEMTQRYSHLADAHKRKLINLLDYSEKDSRIIHEYKSETVSK